MTEKEGEEEMILCSKCNKRPAVVFVSNTADSSDSVGYCLTCAKEMGIKPVTDIMEKMGISEEDLDMMQNQHQKDMATSDVTAPAEASEEPKPQVTRFKVVSPKDKISPQQVHENDLSPCVGFNRRI